MSVGAAVGAMGAAETGRVRAAAAVEDSGAARELARAAARRAAVAAPAATKGAEEEGSEMAMVVAAVVQVGARRLSRCSLRKAKRNRCPQQQQQP